MWTMLSKFEPKMANGLSRRCSSLCTSIMSSQSFVWMCTVSDQQINTPIMHFMYSVHSAKRYSFTYFLFSCLLAGTFARICLSYSFASVIHLLIWNQIMGPILRTDLRRSQAQHGQTGNVQKTTQNRKRDHESISIISFGNDSVLV